MKNQEQIDKKFLYKENKQLRLQLKEAKELIKIHKQAVFRLSQPNSGHSAISILLDLISKNKYESKIDKLNEKILSLESHQMVLQKIVEQTDNDQKETYHILAQEYQKIQKDNERLENKLLQFYGKIGEVDYLSGLVTKQKEVIIPSEQAVAFKKEQDQLLQFIAMQKQTIRKLTQEKNKLLKINIHMKQSVEKHKDEVRNMTMILNSPDALMNISMQQQNNHEPSPALESNILDQLNEQQDGNKVKSLQNVNNSAFNMSSLNGNTSLMNLSTNKGLNTTMNFIKMQRKIIKQQQQQGIGSEEQSEEEYDCPQLNILFPDKIEKIKKDKQIVKVPYLNMMKIRELMAKRDNKIRKEIQADNRHINPTDKIIKLQIQLEITRKQLTSQTLKFRTMSQELKAAMKLNEELMYRNELLLNANQRLQANYANVYKDYQLTKIIALRVEKAMANKLQGSQLIMDQINTTEDFDEKINSAETALRKIFGKKVTPVRSQSLGK